MLSPRSDHSSNPNAADQTTKIPITGTCHLHQIIFFFVVAAVPPTYSHMRDSSRVARIHTSSRTVRAMAPVVSLLVFLHGVSLVTQYIAYVTSINCHVLPFKTWSETMRIPAARKKYFVRDGHPSPKYTTRGTVLRISQTTPWLRHCLCVSAGTRKNRIKPTVTIKNNQLYSRARKRIHPPVHKRIPFVRAPNHKPELRSPKRLP